MEIYNESHYFLNAIEDVKRPSTYVQSQLSVRVDRRN